MPQNITRTDALQVGDHIIINSAQDNDFRAVPKNAVAQALFDVVEGEIDAKVAAAASDEILEPIRPQLDKLNVLSPVIGTGVEDRAFVLGDDNIIYQNLSGAALPFPQTFPASGFVPNSEQLTHWPNLIQLLIDAALINGFVQVFDGVPGAFTKLGETPVDISAITGQSGANGQAFSSAYDLDEEEDTFSDALSFAWNGRVAANNDIIPGSAVVPGQEGTNPYNRNNIGLQATRTITAATGKPRINLNYSKGSTPYPQWLLNPPTDDTDMYAAMNGGILEMFEFIGVEPYALSSIILIVGGSSQDLESISTKPREDPFTEELTSWAGATSELHARWVQEPWFDRSTMIILGEGAQGNIDRFNSGIAAIMASGSIPNLFAIRHRHEELRIDVDPATNDSNHFGGDANTRIGIMAGNLELSPSIAQTSRMIDEPVILPLADFQHNIARAYLFIARNFTFTDDGHIKLKTYLPTLNLTGAETILGVPEHISSRIRICGERTGTQGAMLDTDFVGADVEADRATRYPIDLAFAQSLYRSHINAGGARAFVTNSTLIFEDILVYCDDDSTFDLIDCDGGSICLHNSTMFGAVNANTDPDLGGTPAIIDVRNGGVGLLVGSGQERSAACLAYGRGNSGQGRGSQIGAHNSRVELPGAVVAEARLRSMIGTGDTYFDVSEVKFQDCTQAVIEGSDFVKILRKGATYTRTGAPTALNDLAAEVV